MKTALTAAAIIIGTLVVPDPLKPYAVLMALVAALACLAAHYRDEFIEAQSALARLSLAHEDCEPNVDVQLAWVDATFGTEPTVVMDAHWSSAIRDHVEPFRARLSPVCSLWRASPQAS